MRFLVIPFSGLIEEVPTIGAH